MVGTKKSIKILKDKKTHSQKCFFLSFYFYHSFIIIPDYGIVKGEFPRLYEQQSSRKKCIFLWYSIEKRRGGFEMDYDENNLFLGKNKKKEHIFQFLGENLSQKVAYMQKM